MSKFDLDKVHFSMFIFQQYQSQMINLWSKAGYSWSLRWYLKLPINTEIKSRFFIFINFGSFVFCVS